MNKEEILKRVKDLEPWHMSIPLVGGLKTAERGTLHTDSTGTNIMVVNPNILKNYLADAYSDEEKKSKTMLDIGCNSGGYCFLAHRLGYKYAEGFDPRAHWINQANFVKEVCKIPDSAISFSENTIETAGLENKKFDITVFKGVLYHIADPIHCLKLICDATNDVVLIGSGSDNTIPPHTFAVKQEKTDRLMSGVEGLSWYPGGPDVVQHVCAHFGFPYSRVVFWRKNKSDIDTRNVSRSSVGRFEVICAKTQEMLDKISYGKDKN